MIIVFRKLNVLLLSVIPFSLLLSLASCKAVEWQSSQFIKKYNYMEVSGFSANKIVDEDECTNITNFPMYPNGINGIRDYLEKKITYPQDALDKEITGTVIISYVVYTDGFVTDVKVQKSVSPSLDKEAVRLIKNMGRWIPGKCNHSAVSVQFNQPVKFSLK